MFLPTMHPLAFFAAAASRTRAQAPRRKPAPTRAAPEPAEAGAPGAAR